MQVNKLSKKTFDLADTAVKEAGQAKEAARNKINKIKERGKNMNKDIVNGAYELGEKARNALDDAETWIENGVVYVENKAKEKPLLTIGVSLLIGMLLGKLSSSK